MKPVNNQLEDSSAINLEAMMACVAITSVESALLMNTAMGVMLVLDYFPMPISVED